MTSCTRNLAVRWRVPRATRHTRLETEPSRRLERSLSFLSDISMQWETSGNKESRDILGMFRRTPVLRPGSGGGGGGGASANFALPRGRAFASPGPTPNFWHARGFLSEYNYTEYFIGKTSRLAHSGQYDTIITRKNLNEIKKKWMLKTKTVEVVIERTLQNIKLV